MAKVSVRFYGPLVEAAKGQAESQEQASTIRELLGVLASSLGGTFKEKVLDLNGGPQQFVNIFVNEKDIRHLNELDTVLNDDDEVLILPAVAGGNF